MFLSGTLIFLIVLLVSWAGTGLVLRALTRRGVFDHPNERSSHDQKIPRGGGIAVVAVVLLAWLGIAVFQGDMKSLMVVGLAFILAFMSFVDDIKTLPPLPRFSAHLVAVGIGVVLLPAGSLVFQGILPPMLDRIAAALLWAWFVNLFNFMDGIDGITGVETACVGGGISLLAAGVGGLDGVELQGLALVAAALGFLVWNWSPARIFLGDVGSIPLGFLLGWLLLQMASVGYWASALILPLYYFADATLTLSRRVWRGKRFWDAHREHFYQRAVQAGLSHAVVVRRILFANLILIILAVFSVHDATITSACAMITVAILLFYLTFARKQKT